MNRSELAKILLPAEGKTWGRPQGRERNMTIRKKNVVPMYNEICSVFQKKKEVLPFMTMWMELEGIWLSYEEQIDGYQRWGGGECG